MGAPLSPLWPGGPRGARTGDGEGRARGGGRERRRGGGRGVRRVWGGRLASSLICKKCITSEIKRKITAPKQNTQSRKDGEKRRWVGREEVQWIHACEYKEGEKRKGGFTCIDNCCTVKSRKDVYKYIGGA